MAHYTSLTALSDLLEYFQVFFFFFITKCHLLFRLFGSFDKLRETDCVKGMMSKQVSDKTSLKLRVAVAQIGWEVQTPVEGRDAGSWEAPVHCQSTAEVPLSKIPNP